MNDNILDNFETQMEALITRYENVTPGEVRNKFLTLLEVEAEDVWQVTTALQQDTEKGKAEGRSTELLQMVAGAVYRQIAEPAERT